MPFLFYYFYVYLGHFRIVVTFKGQVAIKNLSKPHRCNKFIPAFLSASAGPFETANHLTGHPTRRHCKQGGKNTAGFSAPPIILLKALFH